MKLLVTLMLIGFAPMVYAGGAMNVRAKVRGFDVKAVELESEFTILTVDRAEVERLNPGLKSWKAGEVVDLTVPFSAVTAARNPASTKK